jgi:hypothetical protein
VGMETHQPEQIHTTHLVQHNAYSCARWGYFKLFMCVYACVCTCVCVCVCVCVCCVEPFGWVSRRGCEALHSEVQERKSQGLLFQVWRL